MKTEYIKPISEVEEYETADIVTTSISTDIPQPPTDNKEPDLGDDDIYDFNIR